MKKTIALAMAALMLLLSGCGGSKSIYSNYRETEHLQLVQALGADADEKGVCLSVSCAKSSQQSSGGIISRSGESILRAMSELQNYSADQQLYYAHAQYVIIGEDYAKSSFDRFLDFIARDTQLRLGLYLFVVRGATARELVTGPGVESYEVSKALASVKRDTDEQGRSHVFTCRETVRSLSENGAALICAVRPADTEDSVFLLESGVTAVPDGYAIIKDGLLAGYIDTDISQAANLIMGHMGSSGVSLPDGKGGTLNLEYESGSAKIKPRWGADGSLEGIELEAKLGANLAEPDSDIGNITDSGLMSALEAELGRDMEDKINSVLQLSKALNADFLGLGAWLRQSNAAKTEALGEDWLKKAEFSVKCEAKISYTRELGDQMGTKGGSN